MEIEIKFRTDAEGQAHALASPLLGSVPEPAKSVRSAYFDTASLDLRKAGIALRIRRNGRAAPIMCAKFSDTRAENPFHRHEVEVEVPNLSPDLGRFDAETASRLAGVVGDRPLERKFETRIERHIRHIVSGDAVIEVAIDDGVITGPRRRRQAVCEVELELKSGDPVALYGLAQQLAARHPFTLDFTSKSDRGFAMTASLVPAPVKSSPVVLDRHMAFDVAVSTILATALGQFVANWDALRQSDDPESVHQLRVALRRLRSALKMVKRVVPNPVLEDLRFEAGRIAAALGPARELDVFIEASSEGPLLYQDRPPGCTGLLRVATDRRAEAYRAARDLIDDPATTLFVLRMQGLIARHGWRHGLPAGDRPMLAAPLRTVAAALLDALHRRVLKRGKHLMRRSDDERHRLRIALKDLRYGIEFFASLFGHRRRVAQLLKTVGLLQDLLGSHNDVVDTAKLVRALSEGNGPDVVEAAGYVIGWQARGIPLADAELVEVWKRFRRLRPSWH